MSDDATILTPDTAQANTDAAEAGQTGANPESVATSWLDSLPEDLREHEALKAFQSPSDLAKAHLETSAAKAELEARMAVPESDDEYVLDIPEGHAVDAGFVKQARAWAKEAGLSKDQFRAFGAKYMAFESEFVKQAKESDKQAMEAMKKEWGAQFETNCATAQKVTQRFLSEEDARYLRESRLGNDPALVRMFHAIGKQISEDSFVAGGSGTPDIKYDKAGNPMLDYSASTSMPKR